MTVVLAPPSAGSFGAARIAVPSGGTVTFAPGSARGFGGTGLLIGTFPGAVVGTAAGARVRGAGLVIPTLLSPLTAAGARTRGGWAFGTIVATGGGGGSGPVSRWAFADPLTNEAYVWEKNPNDGGNPDRKRTLSTTPTLAGDGTPLTFEGEEPIWQITLKGTILTKSQYDNMTYWFSKRHILLLTDDLGRQMQVVPETFQPARAWVSHHAYRHTYTATLRLLGYGTARILNAGSTLVLA